MDSVLVPAYHVLHRPGELLHSIHKGVLLRDRAVVVVVVTRTAILKRLLSCYRWSQPVASSNSHTSGVEVPLLSSRPATKQKLTKRNVSRKAFHETKNFTKLFTRNKTKNLSKNFRKIASEILIYWHSWFGIWMSATSIYLWYLIFNYYVYSY